jgi:hypothetical protein
MRIEVLQQQFDARVSAEGAPVGCLSIRVEQLP